MRSYIRIPGHILLNPLLKRSLLATAIILLTAGHTVQYQSAASWEPLRWGLEKSSSGDSGRAMMSKVEEIEKIFRNAATLDPPVGMGVDSRGEFLKRVSLPENTDGPEPARLRLGFRIPPEAIQQTAGVNIWINDPHNLLGEPVITDGEGDIFMLPPQAGQLEGQAIISRSAHPAGYDEKYPSMSTFPLWAGDVEPFLRSVVRPTFQLARGTATVLFTTGGRPFWLPVSQERWIRALIEKADAGLAEFRAGVNAAEKTDITSRQMEQMKNYLRQMRNMYDEKAIIERYDKLRSELLKTIDLAEKMNPGDGKKYYQEMIEPLDRQLVLELESAPGSRARLQEYEEQLLRALVTREEVWTEADASIRNGDWDRLEEIGREYELESLVLLADTGRAREKLQAELNGLSPAERRATAWGFELPPWHPVGPHRHVVAMPFEAERASGLVNPGTEGARALVSLDSGFFSFDDRNAPIHILAVEWWGNHDTRYGAQQRTLLNDLWRSLDWQALRQMVNQAP